MAGIIAMMMLSFVLLASVFVALESHHDCDGEDCPICECIEQCENTLRGAGRTEGKQVSFLLLTVVFLTAFAVFCAVSPESLVSKKVRLNN